MFNEFLWIYLIVLQLVALINCNIIPCLSNGQSSGRPGVAVNQTILTSCGDCLPLHQLGNISPTQIWGCRLGFLFIILIKQTNNNGTETSMVNCWQKIIIIRNAQTMYFSQTLYLQVQAKRQCSVNLLKRLRLSHGPASQTREIPWHGTHMLCVTSRWWTWTNAYSSM